MDEIVEFKPKTYVLPIDIGEPYKGVLDMKTGILYTEKVNPKMTVEELIDLTEIKELPDVRKRGGKNDKRRSNQRINRAVARRISDGIFRGN